MPYITRKTSIFFAFAILLLTTVACGEEGTAGEQMEVDYRERRLVDLLLQQQALIDALKSQVSSMQPNGV